VQECELRKVRDLIFFRDPTGNPIELVVRPEYSGRRYFAPRDAGITGFSHVGLCTTDPQRDERFWTRVCNARVSDRIGDAPLLRIDEIHHTIALFPTDRAGIQHINHQVESADDIQRSYHFLRERQVDIVFGPGRHPTSSAKFLYFQGPDGMVFEYSSGVRSIADELLYRERQFPFEPRGFCQWGAKPKIAEFRT
jgi:2,3-dihydroxy-p-cumate/2,3-dihydroxybenzoate 3,4-dioxygenase